MPWRQVSFLERMVATILGAVFGCIIGLAVAWLLMFSATLGIAGLGPYAVSFRRSALAGAIFFAAAGLLTGSAAGTFIGRVFAGIFEFEQFFGRRDPFWVEALIAFASIAFLLWVNGVLVP